jgi:hypothetical protein
MDPSLLGIAGLAALGAAAALLWALYHRAEARKLGQPVRRLSEARPGRQVAVRGKVKSDELLTSPVSDRRCVYLSVLIREEGGIPLRLSVSPTPRRAGGPRLRGHGRASGVELLSSDAGITHREQVDTIQLTDGESELKVDLRGADIELLVDQSLKARSDLATDGEVLRILRRFGVATGVTDGGRYRLTETLLEPGDEVVAVGELGVDGAGQLTLHGDRDEPLHLTDADPAEMARASRGKARAGFLLTAVGLALAGLLVFLGMIQGAPPPPADPGPMRDFRP